MTKIFCDRCGKEILNGETRVVKVEDVMRARDGDYSYLHRYDVCLTCAKIIQRFIEGKEETQ